MVPGGEMKLQSYLAQNLLLVLVCQILFACTSVPGPLANADDSLAPPVAARKPYTHVKFGDKREDPYFWLRERENPEVVTYLKNENAYTQAQMKSTESLQTTLFNELKSRMKETDQTAPYKDGAFMYYSRTVKGLEYRIHARKPVDVANAPEEVLLDVNKMAEAHSYYSLVAPTPSPSHEILAYAVDTVGRRFYDIYFKDLKTGEILRDKIEKTTGDFVWANDNRTLFYVTQDPETLRADKVFRYVLGSGLAPQQVYFEKDETFNVEILKSHTDQYLVLQIESTMTSEARILNADEPTGNFKVFLPRERGHEYSFFDGGDRFYILTNWKAQNFRLMSAPKTATMNFPPKSHWSDVIPHNSNRLIEDVFVFQNFIALLERDNGLTTLSILDRATGHRAPVKMKDPIYVVSFGDNTEFHSEKFRFEYESMNTPPSVYDLDVKTGEMSLQKRLELLGAFRTDNYETKRLWAKGHDGVKIPLSVLMKKGTTQNGANPLLLYGYGSYGLSMDPYFSRNIFSLVDRGFIYVIAHVRGGSEMGRKWYEDGRQDKKKSSFKDFIAASEYLIKQKYTSPKHLYAEGGSAGGLLMGAVINMRPDLYNGVIASVPFVDVLTTMLDDSIPLTTGEYDEWGNPNEKKYYDYIKSYSPYDNIKPQAYPNLLVETGLHDSQVQYWEPAKWVARLRTGKTDRNLLLLRTEMEEGHGGKTGRYQQLKDLAFEYSWYLMLEKKNY